MSKNELERFRAVLTSKVAELERSSRQREGIVIDRSADQLDETQAASQRALVVSSLDREFKEVRNACAALRRIEEGCFGVCQECDQNIHPKRLAAVPWAALCIRCQEVADGSLEREQTSSADLSGRAGARSAAEHTRHDNMRTAA